MVFGGIPSRFEPFCHPTFSGVNLALLRPALASSQRLPQEHVSRMTDGLVTTSWASAAGDLQPWAWVDLLKVYNVPGRIDEGTVSECGKLKLAVPKDFKGVLG